MPDVRWPDGSACRVSRFQPVPGRCRRGGGRLRGCRECRRPVSARPARRQARAAKVLTAVRWDVAAVVGKLLQHGAAQPDAERAESLNLSSARPARAPARGGPQVAVVPRRAGQRRGLPVQLLRIGGRHLLQLGHTSTTGTGCSGCRRGGCARAAGFGGRRGLALGCCSGRMRGHWRHRSVAAALRMPSFCKMDPNRLMELLLKATMVAEGFTVGATPARARPACRLGRPASVRRPWRAVVLGGRSMVTAAGRR